MKARAKEGDVYHFMDKIGRSWLVVIARVGQNGVPLGYFFDGSEMDSSIVSRNAKMICAFGTVGISNGEWKLIKKRPPNWRREDWPVPRFKRVNDDGGVYNIVVYDDDFKHVSSFVPKSEVEGHDLPLETLFGHKALEFVLTKISD